MEMLSPRGATSVVLAPQVGMDPTTLRNLMIAAGVGAAVTGRAFIEAFPDIGETVRMRAIETFDTLTQLVGRSGGGPAPPRGPKRTPDGLHIRPANIDAEYYDIFIPATDTSSRVPLFRPRKVLHGSSTMVQITYIHKMHARTNTSTAQSTTVGMNMTDGTAPDTDFDRGTLWNTVGNSDNGLRTWEAGAYWPFDSIHVVSGSATTVKIEYDVAYVTPYKFWELLLRDFRIKLDFFYPNFDPTGDTAYRDFLQAPML